jgi:hypothetical protein
MKLKFYFCFSVVPNLPSCEFSPTFLPKYQLSFNPHRSTLDLVGVQVYGVSLSGRRSKGKGRNRPGLDSIFRRNINGRNASLGLNTRPSGEMASPAECVCVCLSINNSSHIL